ncbi:energy transducer TonB [Apibacter raozihei]|uniref:energy transducer TonB n=1 Tax=Apibacter raozihei TaxID=2500547 RepID=UPI000FE2BD79|nr:energy transducer TonB [Apibacter raozihei]
MKNKWLFYIKKRIEIVMIIFLLIVLGLVFLYLKPETENKKKVFNVYRESDNKKVSETMIIPEPKKKVTLYKTSESNAIFIKGDVTQYISQFIEYTDEASYNGIEGRILIKFAIEKDGTISNVRVVGKKLGYGLDEMAIKAVYKTNKMWKPGKVDGKPVRTNFRLPITFRLPPE